MQPPKTALLVIDVQQGFDDPRWGTRNNPQAESQIATLLDAWRTHTLPVFHIQHLSKEPDSPLRPNQPGCAFKTMAIPQPGEPVIQKHVNSAFIGTDLEQRLRAGGIGRLVIAGLTTNHCVSSSARMAGNLGFQTVVVADATAAYDLVGPDGTAFPAETIHKVALANLHGEFAAVLTTQAVLERTEKDRP